jgi:FtsZ-binding cell division protein ZapB
MSYDARRFAESGLQEITRTMHVIPEASEVGTDHSTVSVSKLSIISPDPLPHPYHGSTSAVFLNMVESPIDAPVDAPQLQSAEPFYARITEDEGVGTPPSEDEPTSDSPPQPNTLRRRSSLKRSNNDLRVSMAFSAKTVSWAMDRDWADQVSKYNAAAGEIEHADREWDAICATYHEELAGMKTLRRNVTQTLTRLRLEAEKLQREDEVIRDQEDKLREGYKQLEQKHGQYREKVKAVLEETEQVLTLCGTKRD